MEYVFVLEINERELEITLELDYTETNDGIGDYEFHGQKCFDRGGFGVKITDWWVISAQWTDTSTYIDDLKNKTKLKDLIADYIESNLSRIKEHVMCEI